MKLYLCLAVLLVAVQAQAAPTFSNVFVVVEENNAYSKVVGNASMPYFNSLIPKGGLATQYYANGHPSLPNYLWMTSGSNDGITQDECWTTPGALNVDNAVRELGAAGVTWRAYMEDLPSAGSTVCGSGWYAGRHNPFLYYSDVEGSSTEKANMVPFTQFASDVSAKSFARYNFISPNVCNDMHSDPSCSNGCTSPSATACYTVADNWLKANIGPLLSSTPFQPGGNGVLIITWDEGSGSTNGGGQVATLLLGPGVKPGYKSTTFYQHQSLLREMLEGLGVSKFPQGAATAPDMAEFFATGTPTPTPTGTATPTPTPTATPTPTPTPTPTITPSPTPTPGSCNFKITAPLAGATVSNPVSISVAQTSPPPANSWLTFHVDGSYAAATGWPPSGSETVNLGTLSTGSHTLTAYECNPSSTGSCIVACNPSVNVTVGSSPSPTPTSTPVASLPRGVLYLTDYDSPSEPPSSVITASYVDGATVRDRWATLEPGDGSYSWTDLDSPLTTIITSAGKKAQILLAVGQQTPCWVVNAGAAVYVPTGNSVSLATFKANCSANPSETIAQADGSGNIVPLPWDTVYQAKLGAFISALAAHVSSTGRMAGISGVVATGITQTTSEVHLCTNGSVPCATDTSGWSAVGYTRAKVQNAYSTILTDWANAFPGAGLSSRFVFDAFPQGFSPAGCSGKDTLYPRELSDIGYGAYPDRYMMAYNGLDNTTTIGGGAGPGNLLPQMCPIQRTGTNLWADCENAAESCHVGSDINAYVSGTGHVALEGLQELGPLGDGNFAAAWNNAKAAFTKLQFIEVYPSDFSSGNVAALTDAHNTLTQ